MRSVALKRIYEPAAPDDGTRVLVDRLWPRGVSKTRAAVDLWLREIAPTPGLRMFYGRDLARWPTFRARYRDELANDPTAREALTRLGEIARRGRVTLLYAADLSAPSHAEVILDALDGAPAQKLKEE